MLTRILTSLVGVVIFFIALFAPSRIFAAAIFVVTAIMLSEMYRVLSCGKLVGVCGYISAALLAAGMILGYFQPAVMAVILLYLAVAVLMHTKREAKGILAHGFVTMFITVFMCYIVKLHSEYDCLAVLWIFIIAWLTDTGAYFIGVFFGKHKLVPHISPKKTVEGAIGGVAFSAIACVVYYFILSASSPDAFVSAGGCLLCAMIGVIGSMLAQIGDFAASCIKRDYGVKDYGFILPGHGGFLDRFDSVVFIAPAVYYLIKLISI